MHFKSMPMLNKRNFIKSMLLFSTIPFTAKAKSILDELPEGLMSNRPDDFWLQVRNDYKLKPDYINLENGYFSMMAQPVLDKYLNDIRTINTEASYYMRTVQYENKQKVTDRLAEVLGCSS